jgi:hypothetical protein
VDSGLGVARDTAGEIAARRHRKTRWTITPMSLNMEKLDRRICLWTLLAVPVGLMFFFIGLLTGGPTEDRLMPGGLSLALTAMVAVAAFVQIRYRITPTRVTWWTSEMNWVHKSECPFRYWYTTFAFVISAIGMLTMTIACFAFSI